MSKQLENLEVLKAAIAATQSTTINLDRWKYKTDCGTLYCAAGLASILPHFNAQGMKLNGDDVPEFNGESIWSEEGEAVATEMFGPDVYENVFSPRGEGRRDAEFPGAEEGLSEYGDPIAEIPQETTDKDLAIWRIDQQIQAIKEAA